MTTGELAEKVALGSNSFRVSSAVVANTAELRFDASYYNPELLAALEILDRSGMKLVTVADVTDRVFMPNRFRRNYVDAEHGLPFLQGSHLVQYDPDDVRYLSTATHELGPVIIRKGWLLITRSGTTGRVAVVPDQWDGWAASEHIFRVVPSNNSECPVGYLATFLSSPLGRIQLTAQIYGAVVDELTEEHVRQVRVPLPVTRKQRAAVDEISALAMQGVSERSASVDLHREAAIQLSALLESEGTFHAARSFTVSSRQIEETPDLRLDATYFGEGVNKALSILEATGMEISTVGEVSEQVFLPPRFRRYYVGKAHGVPFLRGANVVEFRPDDVMYLSRAIHRNLDSLTIHEGWILITRSGTVGRVVVVSSEWEGWTATEDTIRVVGSGRCDPHYLGMFLASPLGKIQLTRQIYGAVVDHLTEDHVRSVRVPLPKTAVEARRVALVTRMAIQAARIRANAVKAYDDSEDALMSLMGVATSATNEPTEFENFEALATQVFRAGRS